MEETTVAGPITKYTVCDDGLTPAKLSSDAISMATEEGALTAQLYEICMQVGEGEVANETVYDRLQPILSESRENQEQLLDILWLLGIRISAVD